MLLQLPARHRSARSGTVVSGRVLHRRTGTQGCVSSVATQRREDARHRIGKVPMVA